MICVNWELVAEGEETADGTWETDLVGIEIIHKTKWETHRSRKENKENE